MKKMCLVAAALLAPLGSARLASAQVNCNDATMFPNPVYMNGSSAIVSMLQKVGRTLNASGQATIIYKASASCDGPNGLKNDADLTGTATAYTADPADAAKVNVVTCNLAAGIKSQIGVSDVAYDACTGEALPATLGDFPAMVQSMLLVVPEANATFTAISAEQARAIWGCGAKSTITPFIEETSGIQQRNKDSGTQIMVSKYIGVPADKLKGKTNAGTPDMIASLIAPGDPANRIGFVAADAYEGSQLVGTVSTPRRALLNAVAFRGFEQAKAYYPDSTATATDKRNVRDGHYMIQGPLHLIAKTSGGAASDAVAKKAIDWLQGTVPVDPANPKSYIDVVAKAGNVPQCAMKVKRDSDGGLLKPYTPAKPCGCYYETVVTGVATPPGCSVCADDTACSGGKKCNYGFCE